MLAAANLTTRLLGVILWPLVTRLFAPFDGEHGDAGTGLARIPISTYQIVLALSSVGFNVSVAKLVAERLALGDTFGARRVFRVALLAMVILGVLFTLGFWWGAPALATLAGQPDTMPGFRAMAPAMILMTLTAAFRGLFQGFQRHSPNGISQMAEAVVRVVTALVLLIVFVRVSIPMGAAAVNFGDVTGAGVAFLYLYWLYRKHQQDLWAGVGSIPTREFSPETTGEVLRRIMMISLPITLIGAIHPLMIQADAIMVNHLLKRPEVGRSMVQAAFGQLSNATQLVWAATLITGAMYTSLLPAVAEAVATRRMQDVRAKARMAYLVTMLTGLPAAAGMWVLGGPLYALVYGGNGGSVLSAAAWSTLFLMLQQTSSGLLQGAGHVTLTTVNLAIGAVVKMVLTYFMLGPLGMGVEGAALATVVGFAIIALLNIWGVRRHLGASLSLTAMVTKPTVAAAVMTVTLGGLLRTWPAPGALITLLWVAVGAAVYVAVLLLVRGVPIEDMAALPGGGRLMGFLRRLRLV